MSVYFSCTLWASTCKNKLILLYGYFPPKESGTINGTHFLKVVIKMTRVIDALIHFPFPPNPNSMCPYENPVCPKQLGRCNGSGQEAKGTTTSCIDFSLQKVKRMVRASGNCRSELINLNWNLFQNKIISISSAMSDRITAF